MQKYIGSDITSMVTLPVIIFEPMTMLQKMAEVNVISYSRVFISFAVSFLCVLSVIFATFLTVNGIFPLVGSSR